MVLSTDDYLPVDSTGIPTGIIGQFTDTKVKQPFQLNNDTDIDDCFIMNTNPSTIPIDTRSQPLRLLATAKHPTTGFHLEVHSTEPAFQFYTGKFIDVPAVNGYPARGPRSGFCVEPSRYINAPNKAAWKGMSVLKKGQVWGSKIVYKAWKD